MSTLETTLVVAAALSGVVAVVVALAARRVVRQGARATARLQTQLAEQRTAADNQEALLRGIIETTPVALLLFTDGGKITFTNAAARDLFFEAAPVEGENFLSMIERAPEPLRRALLADGDELFTVDNPAGAETFHLAKRYFADAQTLIAVRHVTQEISRQEIATLKKVIRIIGHEVNNSLGPISSLTQSAKLILKRPEHLPKLENILQTVEERATHLSAFLGGYAQLAKIPQPRPLTVPWGPFLDGLRALYPDIQIAQPPEANGHFDPAQIQQVIINLVKNAREAGGPATEVHIAVERVPDGGFRIAVLDRGSGMSEEALQSALLPFYTTKPKGSGLGLTLCREIVELHRGRLRLARREGGGMEISFWLPEHERALSPTSLVASKARLTLTRG